MKYKYLIFFLLIFIFITPTKALTPNIEYIDGVYSNRKQGNITHYGQLGFIVVNGKVLYCLDPYTLIGGDYIENNNYFNNYDSETLRYLKLVSTFADINVQNRNVQYYMAAQEMIWEKILGGDYVYWTNQNKTNGMILDVNPFKEDLQNQINNFNLKPSFDGSNIKGNFYDTIELNDTNNVINTYEIINDSKNQVWFGGSKIYIRILSSEPTTIKFKRKVGSGNPQYFHSDTNQDFASLSSEVYTEASITVQANNKYNENVTVQFVDKETNKLINEPIDFVINEESYTTSNGNFLKNMEEGNYELHLKKVPKDYVIDKSYNFSVKEENLLQNRTVIIPIEKAKGQINIDCYEGIYQLYKNNILISTFTNSSSISTELGNYYLIDFKNNKKYDVELKYKDQYTPIIYAYLHIKDEYVNNDKKSIKNSIVNVGTNDDITHNKPNSKKIKELPNTVNYIKIIKTFLIILLCLIGIKYVKTKKK